MICDDKNATEKKGHKTYSTRNQNGKPLDVVLGVSAAVRSAYEAITNSRFGVFLGTPVAKGNPAESMGEGGDSGCPRTRGWTRCP